MGRCKEWEVKWWGRRLAGWQAGRREEGAAGSYATLPATRTCCRENGLREDGMEEPGHLIRIAYSASFKQRQHQLQVERRQQCRYAFTPASLGSCPRAGASSSQYCFTVGVHSPPARAVLHDDDSAVACHSWCEDGAGEGGVDNVPGEAGKSRSSKHRTALWVVKDLQEAGGAR